MPPSAPFPSTLGAAITVAVVACLATVYWWRRARVWERGRRLAAEELSRRLSELFSLQELAYVLSDSLQLGRIVEQVARYSMRFLDARGALLALVSDDPARTLHVAAAEGTLSGLLGIPVAPSDPGLLGGGRGREHLELLRAAEGGAVQIAAGVTASSAAAVPLRAHGLGVGTLVIADPQGGAFEPQHVRLLSTVATHAAIVLANARFFAMVERAKEQWETAFDALREGMAVVDAGGQVQRANLALASLLGRPVPALIGADLATAVFGGSPTLESLLEQARGGARSPALVARSDLLGRTLRLTAAPIPSTDGARSVVVLIEDVTEQQSMEAQLIQSEKLAAVGQLVSGVAHELNNPLTSIAGLSELLLEQRDLGPKNRDHLQVIHEQAERAGHIVRNLLTFARKAPPEPAPVDLNEVIRRTLQLLEYDLRMTDVALEQDLAPDLPMVLGDRNALQQAVLNLLTNAAHAVAGQPAGSSRRVTVQTWSDAQVHVRVTDSGPGIPDEVKSHIFTPFFTTKEPGQGTGLGLSITYSIIETHRGRITLEHNATGGAAFRIDLPPAAAAKQAGPVEPIPTAETSRPTVEPAPGGRTTMRRILLVDDDPAVGRLVSTLFTQEGHAVEVARSAAHALELAATPWDLVIADGRATTRGRLFVEELLERHPALHGRTLVVTGDVQARTEEVAARLGLPYLRKPFDLRRLRAEAARLWEPAALL